MPMAGKLEYSGIVCEYECQFVVYEPTWNCIELHKMERDTKLPVSSQPPSLRKTSLCFREVFQKRRQENEGVDFCGFH